MRKIKYITYFFYLLTSEVEKRIRPFPFWRKFLFISLLYLAAILAMIYSTWLTIFIMIYAGHVAVYNYIHLMKPQMETLMAHFEYLLSRGKDANNGNST